MKFLSGGLSQKEGIQKHILGRLHHQKDSAKRVNLIKLAHVEGMLNDVDISNEKSD